jgi:hypothetical protein
VAAVPAPAAPVRGQPEQLALPRGRGASLRFPARPDLDRSGAGPRGPNAVLYLGLAGTALALAGLSLLLPSTPSYDPWAWLGWGRELVHLNLHTTGGPSWKPLPVLFTTLFAPLGAAQPDLWLAVARAGALMAVGMTFRLAFRITARLLPHAEAAGRVARWGLRGPALLAGLVAAASLANSSGFIAENALGYSEGLATALMLIALDRLMDGLPRQTLVLGFLAALDRPELWFAWVPLAAWVWRSDPAARRLVLGLAALTPALWLLPELWGSGQLFRGVVRAHQPSPGSAPFTRCPFCTVLEGEAWPSLMPRVTIPAILAPAAAAALPWRGRFSAARRARGGGPSGRRLTAAERALGWTVALAGGGCLWWLGIAVETQAGFAGNGRYLELGTALLAIAGGAAWGWIALGLARGLSRISRTRWVLPRRWGSTGLAGGLVAAAVLVDLPPWIGREVVDLPRQGQELTYQAQLRADLGRAIGRSGGAGALLHCGAVMTEGYQVPMLAWMLGAPIARIHAAPVTPSGPPWPGVILQDRAQPHSALLPAPAQIQAWEHAGARYTLLARVRTFSVFSTCPHKVRS